jgi:hypothetical protein
MGTMATDHKPTPAAAALFGRHKRHKDALAALDEPVKKAAIEEMRLGATAAQLADLTGISDEVFRKLARLHGIERKREPTVGRDAKPRKPATPPARTPEREPEPWAEPSVLIAPDAGPDVSEMARRFPPPEAERLVRRIIDRNPQWHREQQQQMADAGIPELKWPLVEIGRALSPDVCILDGSDLRE